MSQSVASPRCRFLGCVLIVAACAATGQAADYLHPRDAVQDFRDALKADSITFNKSPESLAYRKENLEKQAERITNAGDLVRALLLQEWQIGNTEKSVADIDLAVRSKMGIRLEVMLRNAINSGKPAEQGAAALLIRETVSHTRNTGTDQPTFQANYVNQLMAAASLHLITLIHSTQLAPDVAEYVVTALAQIEPVFYQPNPNLPGYKVKPDLGAIDGILREQLHSDNVIVRRAAALALGELAQTMTRFANRHLTNADAINYRFATLDNILGETVIGLHDPDASVRRFSIDACLNIADSGITLVPEPQAPASNPTPGRKYNGDEIAEIQKNLQKVKTYQYAAEKLLDPFKKITPVIAQASLTDSNVGVRIVSRQVLEKLAIIRQRLVRYEASVPFVKGMNRSAAPRKVLEIPVMTPEPSTQGPTFAPNLPHVPTAAIIKPVAYWQPEMVPAPTPLPHSRTLDAVTEGLKDPDVRARLASVDVLEAMGDSAAPAMPQLVGALSDSDRFVRWAAARTIGKLAPIQPSIAVPKLAEMMKETDIDVRIAALSALERYGSVASDAVPAVTYAALNGDAEPRNAAMKTLWAIGLASAPALPSLTRNLTSTDSRVRQAAAETIGYIGYLAASVETDTAKREQLMKHLSAALRPVLSDTEPEVRRAATDAMLRVFSAAPQGR